MIHIFDALTEVEPYAEMPHNRMAGMKIVLTIKLKCIKSKFEANKQEKYCHSSFHSNCE